MHPKFIHIGGQKVAYYESNGKNRPVFFIHSNSTSASMFSRQLESRLGERYRLVAIDLPGHGASAPSNSPDTVYSLPGYAEVLIDAAIAIGAEDAIFVGWSLGGHILLEAADRLKSASAMLIFGTPPVGNPPNMAEAFLPGPASEALFKAELTDEEIEAWASVQFGPGAKVPTSFAEDIRRTDGRAREYLGRSFGNLCYRDELKAVNELNVPLAIFHGEKDGCVNGAYFNDLVLPTLWREKVQVIEEAGHSPQWEKPEKFNALLEEFIGAASDLPS